MKHSIKLATLLLAALAAGSCEKNNGPTDSGDPLVMSSSVETVVLAEVNATDEAVTFSWNHGLDRGSGTSLNYAFKLDIAGNDFSTSIPLEELGPDVFSRTFTVAILNDLLTGYWGIYPGETVELEAKVIARVEADKFIKPEVATTKIVVTSYQLSSRPIFIVGSATEAGWNPSQAILMNEIGVGSRYTYVGDFTVGEYEFLTGTESITPAYIKGENDSKLKYRLNESEPDNRFSVAHAGRYEISINIITLEHKITYRPRYSNLYMVGDASPKGWDMPTAIALTWIENTPIFTYEGELKPGALKFAIDQRDWFVSFLMPMVVSQSDLTQTGIQEVPPNNGVDNRWIVGESNKGLYRITIDVDHMTILFERLGDFVRPGIERVYIVGDASPNGWEITQATELTWQINSNFFVYQGPLIAGQLKFAIDNPAWSSDFFMPVQAVETPPGSDAWIQVDLTRTDMQIVGPGGVDYKWAVTAVNAGTYKVTLDVVNMTITFQKQP